MASNLITDIRQAINTGLVLGIDSSPNHMQKHCFSVGLCI